MSSSVTSGCVQAIFTDAKPTRPVVQLIELKRTNASDPNAAPRYKGIISDGEKQGPALLVADPSALLVSETVRLNATVRLTNYLANKLPNSSTKLCVIMGMELVEQLEEKIGEPIMWDAKVESAEAADGTSLPAKATPAKAGQPANTTPETNVPMSRVAPAPRINTPVAPPATLGRPTPIEGLNPYMNKWTIRVRVTSKGDLRTVDTRVGPTPVFSMDLCDESGEIRATCWREAAEKFSKVVEVGKVYLISRGQLRIANKKYSAMNNEYEMSLGFDAFIQLCAEEPASMPTIRYNFITIADIANKPKDANVDIIGVAHDISTVSRVMIRSSGKEIAKRTFKIADDSGAAIEVTIWGERAEAFPEEGTPVIACKGLRVSEWNTKSLGFNFTSSFETNPSNLDATARLSDWWSGGGSSSTTSLSISTGGSGAGAMDDSRKSLAEVKALQLGSEPEYANIRATISRVSPSSKQEERPIWYSSCTKCSRKVVGDEGSGFSCESCGWSGAQCTYRYILSLAVSDATTTAYVSAFNDQATALLGKTADDLKALKEQSETEYQAVLDAAAFKRYVFRMRAKMETYQDQARQKLQVLSLKPIDFATEAKALLKEIELYGPREQAAPMES